MSTNKVIAKKKENIQPAVKGKNTTDSDEIVSFKLKEFEAYNQNQDDTYRQCYEEGIGYALETRAEKKKNNINIKYLDQLNEDNLLLENKIEILQNELNIYKQKNKGTLDMEKIKNSNKRHNYTPEYKKQIMDDEWKKNNYDQMILDYEKSLQQKYSKRYIEK